MLITGVGFFAFLLFNESGSWGITALFGSTPLAICVFFGSLQNCFARASKYTLFDATKELTFIPLDPEVKLKGKAVIDGVGSRLGKSGGSLIHQCLLMAFGSVALSTPYVASIFLVAIGAWIAATRGLGKRFTALISSKETRVSEETPAEKAPEQAVEA
jgi:AAA family ATP:ADP antiporter